MDINGEYVMDNMIKGQISIFDFLEDVAKEVNIKGLCDDGFCPECNEALVDGIEKCPKCKTRLKWEHWGQVNRYKFCEECDVAFGSIICFERRGQVYDRIHREWIKDIDGKPVIRQAGIQCERYKEFIYGER